MERRVRIVVVGDKGVGKTSLINALVEMDDEDELPSKAPPVLLVSDKDHSCLQIIDTSSNPHEEHRVNEDIKHADFVFILFSVIDKQTSKSLSERWIPRIKKIRGKSAKDVPLAIVGTKYDLLKEKDDTKLRQLCQNLMDEYDEIECALFNCALKSEESKDFIDTLFWHAQQLIVYPKEPLCDKYYVFTKGFNEALKRIFMFFDRDKDGYLDNADIHEVQSLCFSNKIDDNSIQDIKDKILSDEAYGYVETNCGDEEPVLVSDDGRVTLAGFSTLCWLLLKGAKADVIWGILRSFGYDDDLMLCDDYCFCDLKLDSASTAAGCRYELSTGSRDWLRTLYNKYTVQDQALTMSNVREIFSVVPSFVDFEGASEEERKGYNSHTKPWASIGFPYCSRVKTLEKGNIGLSLDAWEGLWGMSMAINPKVTLKTLAYAGLTASDNSKVVVETTSSSRSVINGFVFGPSGVGKSGLLGSLISKKASYIHQQHIAILDHRKQLNRNTGGVDKVPFRAISKIEGKDKWLLLHEFRQEDQIPILSSASALSNCDIIIFVYSHSDYNSFLETTKLFNEFVKVVRMDKLQIPVSIVAAKSDLPAMVVNPGDATPTSFFGKYHLVPKRISVDRNKLDGLFEHIVETVSKRQHPTIPKKWRSGYYLVIGAAFSTTAIVTFLALTGGRYLPNSNPFTRLISSLLSYFGLNQQPNLGRTIEWTDHAPIRR